MTEAPFSDDECEVYALLGMFVIAWNQAEFALQMLLVNMGDKSLAAKVMAAELGSVGMANALKSVARSYDEKIDAAVDHLCKYVARVREYRNYYVHGIAMVDMRDGAAFASITSASAKGKLVIDIDNVSASDLNEAIDRTKPITEAALAIVDTISLGEGGRVHPPLPSPQTLPLPDAPKKNRVIPPLDRRPLPPFSK